nr:MAG TPA: hypothetical protein [Caudoviricetes sp.]
MGDAGGAVTHCNSEQHKHERREGSHCVLRRAFHH